jgi:hypothetical protein
MGLVHPIVIVEVVDPILKGGSNEEEAMFSKRQIGP